MIGTFRVRVKGRKNDGIKECEKCGGSGEVFSRECDRCAGNGKAWSRRVYYSDNWEEAVIKVLGRIADPMDIVWKVNQQQVNMDHLRRLPEHELQLAFPIRIG